MENSAVSYLHVNIDAKGCEPRSHVEHDDGTVSIALHPVATTLCAYLTGTPDELLELAARIVAAIPATECHPLAGMHVDPHTCGLRARDDAPSRRDAPCTCRGYDAADPCGHGDTSEGCPRHDPEAFVDWLTERAGVHCPSCGAPRWTALGDPDEGYCAGPLSHADAASS